MATRLEQAARQAKSGQLTRQWALTLVNEISSMAGQPILDPTTARDFLNRLIEQRRPTLAEGTLRKYEHAVESFLSAIGGAADGPIGLIDQTYAIKWKDICLRNGRSPSTVKGDIRFLKPAFEEAMVQHLVSENPFKDLRLPSVAAGRARQKKKPFSWKQFQDLLERTDGEWRLLILIAGYTGQRQKDVSKLKYKQLDMANNCITFRRAKTRDEYVVPMHPQIKTALVSWMREEASPDDYLMPELATAPATTTKSLSDRFRFEILPKIGIVQPHAKRGSSKGRQVSEYSFHSLRHMLSTELNKLGVSPETRMLIVGHADKAVSARYTHAQLADAARALEMLPARG